MADAIAVLNAGSSSLKFSLFAERGNVLELTVRGQTEGLPTNEELMIARHTLALLERADVPCRVTPRPWFRQEPTGAELLVSPQMPQMQT